MGEDLCVIGGKALVVDYYSGLHWWDISDIDNLEYLGLSSMIWPLRIRSYLNLVFVAKMGYDSEPHGSQVDIFRVEDSALAGQNPIGFLGQREDARVKSLDLQPIE